MALMPFPFYYVPPQPQPAPTVLERDPCPACKGTSYVFKNLTLVCNTCGRTPAHAERYIKSVAQRDGNGSLLCQKCNDPYPYAEPNEDGGFVCTSCKT